MFVDGFYNAGSGISASVGLFWNAHTGTTMPTSLATVTSAFASAIRAPHMDISLGTAYTGE
ncbi:MAG: hypothetical protein CMC15_18460 [Flavobacteriaceae bacterium]|nr:hypothetical protein [Flavobacteriaceae bacterium]